jgi:hypothetical protein
MLRMRPFRRSASSCNCEAIASTPCTTSAIHLAASESA